MCNQVQQLLEANGIHCSADPSRGWDHGVFVPLALMFPLADVPICQLSMPITRSPSLCYAMGRALLPLRSDNVIIIGSGSSFHNSRAMFSSDPNMHSTRTSTPLFYRLTPLRAPESWRTGPLLRTRATAILKKNI